MCPLLRYCGERSLMRRRTRSRNARMESDRAFVGSCARLRMPADAPSRCSSCRLSTNILTRRPSRTGYSAGSGLNVLLCDEEQINCYMERLQPPGRRGSEMLRFTATGDRTLAGAQSAGASKDAVGQCGARAENVKGAGCY